MVRCKSMGATGVLGISLPSMHCESLVLRVGVSLLLVVRFAILVFLGSQYPARRFTGLTVEVTSVNVGNRLSGTRVIRCLEYIYGQLMIFITMKSANLWKRRPY